MQKVDYNKVWKDDWKDITSYGPSYKTRYRIIRTLMEMFEFDKEEVLDVGCGDGAFLKSLRKSYPNLSLNGFDISDEIVSKNMDNIHLSTGDLTKDETIPNKKFDIIICSEVLEHIEDYQKAIINLSKMLKPGGYVFISSPYGMKNWTAHDTYARHVRRWELGVIEEELIKNNICITISFTWGRIFYNSYYKYFLAKQNPKKLMRKKGFVKEKIFAPLLYNMFKFDDMFKTKGRIIFIVGRKI